MATRKRNTGRALGREGEPRQRAPIDEADSMSRRVAQVVTELTLESLAKHGQQAPRKMAEASFESAILSLIRAFNMTDSPSHPWRFSKGTREEVKQIYFRLRYLFDNGGFSRDLGAIAQGDAGFQRFMARASTPAKQ